MLASLALIVVSGHALAANPHVVFEVPGRGDFELVIRKDQAPILVAHFMGLVDRKFYDGTLFHRRVPDFVLQGGDPMSKKVTSEWARAHAGEHGGTKGLGDGGSGTNVPFEINDLTHVQYAMGMALSSPMDNSGDSQFFINLKDNHRLDGMYVVFGEVIRGQNVVAACQRGDRIRRVRRVGRS